MTRRFRIAFCLLLASCAMGPDYERPAVEAPQIFRQAEPHQIQGPEAESIANLAWWELLKDQELQRLVRIALAENKDLKRAAASVEEYQARLYSARMEFAPTVNASLLDPMAKTGGFGPAGFPTPFNKYADTSVSWELDIWGRVRRTNEAARAQMFAQEENKRAVILELVSGVAEAYFDLRQLDLQQEIAKRTLGAWEEAVKIAQARLKQGVISQLDADQFEAERAGAAARIAELERARVQKENQLSLLLGRNPGAIPRGRSLTDQEVPMQVPAGLPSDLLQRRPDIVVAEQDLHAATARIGVAQAERFPKLTLTGLLGVASPQLSNLLTGGSQFGAVGLGLAGPIFSAQTLGFEKQAAEAQAKQALASYEKSILVAFKEVDDALVSIKTSREQVEAQEAQVKALRSALNLAEKRYQGGLASYLDVLLARRNLFDSELALTSTRRLRLVAVVQVYKALGGGWPPGGAEPAKQDAAPVAPPAKEPAGK